LKPKTLEKTQVQQRQEIFNELFGEEEKNEEPIENNFIEESMKYVNVYFYNFFKILNRKKARIVVDDVQKIDYSFNQTLIPPFTIIKNSFFICFWQKIVGAKWDFEINENFIHVKIEISKPTTNELATLINEETIISLKNTTLDW
jgi:hypothetical protein